MVNTGAPNVMLGTKWPSIMSTCNQSDPFWIVSEHAAPRAAKSAERIDGAMIAFGGIAKVLDIGWREIRTSLGIDASSKSMKIKLCASRRAMLTGSRSYVVPYSVVGLHNTHANLWRPLGYSKNRLQTLHPA